MPNRVQILKQKFSQSVGLPFRDILPESTIQSALTAEKVKYRRRLFDPIVTIWAFLSQVLDLDKSCHNAVSRVVSWLASVHAEIPSTDTSAYCQARNRLPETLLARLFEQVGQGLEEQVTNEHLWCGRQVKVREFGDKKMAEPSTQQDISLHTTRDGGKNYSPPHSLTNPLIKVPPFLSDGERGNDSSREIGGRNLPPANSGAKSRSSSASHRSNKCLYA